MPVLHPDPARIPPHLHSELQVLAALRTLPPDAHVFTRLSILDEKTNEERELDFLVIHPDLGLVIVEVKGRGVEPRSNYWIRRREDKTEEVLKETPGEQLNAQQFSLLRYLKAADLRFVPAITRVLAVPALPLQDDESLGPDLPACRILTKGKLGRMFVALRQAVSGGEDWEAWRRSTESRNHSVRPDEMRGLLEALTPRLLPPPSVAEIMEEEGRVQDQASLQLLDHLASNFSRGRFHVAGGPGSGKSLLARQVTRLWAAEGRRVLVIAFNRALTYATQCMLEELVRENQVNVSTYHDLAANLLHGAGRSPVKEDDTTFFGYQLPDGLTALLAHPEIVPDRWDALIVDEAQDLDPGWVNPLLNLLTDPEHDPVLLLEDPAQNLYREARHDLGQPWRIDLSLRQHPAIRRAACLAYPECGWPPPEEIPGDGAVSFQRSSPEAWKRDLEAQLDELAKEGIQPHQVMILSRRKPTSLGLKDGQNIGPWRLNAVRDWWEDDKAEHVRMGSVHAFKGLEADVVIYLAQAYKDSEGARLAYTAYSRARHRLIVLEKALPQPAPRESTVPAAKEPVAQPVVPQVRTFSENHRQSLMEALTVAKSWRPGKLF